jgi:RNase P subunit RPR2
MGKAAEWLREERRRTLGDWVAFCLGCGFVQRYFEEFEGELPSLCPQCAGEVRARCPECDARFASAFAVDCEACGAPLRPKEQFGVRIRSLDAPSYGSARSGSR